MKKVLSFAVLLAAAAMFGTPAHAAVSISLSTTSFATTTQVAQSNGNSVTYSNSNFNGFVINTMSVLKNGHGGQTAMVESSVTTIKNNGSNPETLYIILGGNGFLSPTTPPAVTLTSNIGGTLSAAGSRPPLVSTGNTFGANDAITFQSYADQSNNVNTTSLLSPNTTGPQAFTFTGFSKATSSQAFGGGNTPPGSVTVPLAVLAAPYSLVEALSVTLNKGGSLNFSTSTIISGGTASTPEPATMTLWGIGLAACGFAARRRRNAKVA